MHLLKRKQAQSTAEYAVVIAIVLAAAVGMQTYIKRALQARAKSATAALLAVNGDTGNVVMQKLDQYEPYTAHSQYTVNRDDSYNESLAGGVVEYKGTLSKSTRQGFSEEAIDVNADAGWQ